MDIVNSSLPTGKKFYPLEEVHLLPLEHLLNRTNIEILRKARKVVNEASANGSYWRVVEGTYHWAVPEGDDKYPIITMKAYQLAQVSQHFATYTSTKKANYLSSERLGLLHAPALSNIKIQYDPERKGVWLHDVEYEGELVSNKPMVINKQLKSAIKTKVGELALEALIGAGEEDLVLSTSRYSTKAHKAERASELIGKILSGNYETTDLADCAVCLGLYGHKYSLSLCASVIDMDNPGSADFDITASARTKLIYHFGGYNLPDNYREWFDN